MGDFRYQHTVKPPQVTPRMTRIICTRCGSEMSLPWNMDPGPRKRTAEKFRAMHQHSIPGGDKCRTT